jgi:hypothetical protein
MGCFSSKPAGEMVRPRDDKAQAVLEACGDARVDAPPRLLKLSALDSALCVRGLVCYWAFAFDRQLDPETIRASLAATLVNFPALAGRARVRARRGATLELEVDLDHPNSGVVFEVCNDTTTTLADLKQNGPAPARNNITPGKMWTPLEIRCCEKGGDAKGGVLCAVRLTHLRGVSHASDSGPATVLAVSWSHAVADGCAMAQFCDAWTTTALTLADLKRTQDDPRPDPRHAPSDVVSAETLETPFPLVTNKTEPTLAKTGRTAREPCHDRLAAAAGLDKTNAKAFLALRLDETNTTPLTLLIGAASLLGGVAFDNLSQTTVHIPAAHAAALKKSLGSKSTNDALVAAVWVLFRRLRVLNYQLRTQKRGGFSFMRAFVRRPTETGCAIQPVNYRGDDVEGLPPNLFGNASLMVCARLGDVRTENMSERGAASLMSRAVRNEVDAAKTREGKQRALGEIAALGTVTTRTQIAAAVAAVGQKDVFISAWQFPELWGFDFDGAGEGGPVYFTGSVFPAAAWTAAAFPGREGGLSIGITVPARVLGQVAEEMQAVVRALSEEETATATE